MRNVSFRGFMVYTLEVFFFLEQSQNKYPFFYCVTSKTKLAELTLLALARWKFELTNQNSAGDKNSTVLTSS